MESFVGEDMFIADRMKNVPKSFIREILKVAVDPKIISFAGGLPNPKSFPVQEIKEACCKVLDTEGQDALQYSTTEGYLPLRKYISERYKTVKGLDIPAEEILITNGSQQGLDLVGKTFINDNDGVIIEEPGYLGAIQAFSVYGPKFQTVKLEDDGVNTEQLKGILNEKKSKLFYSIPNFQNPSGITYSLEKRKMLGEILKDSKIIFVEDDPYGELRFMGEDIPPVRKFYEDGILLGTFSKTVTPSFRLGWVCAKGEKYDKLTIAKQAADLHTNYFSQRVLYQYLVDNDINNHIDKIKELYKAQRETMVKAMEEYFPKEVSFTKPEGGMFLWVTLPENMSSMELFERAIKKNVAFVPGAPFYSNGAGSNTLRLNYSNVAGDVIIDGIKRLADSIKEML